MSAPQMVLGGRYEVGELIGRGGMAEVHKGHDTRLGRPVAIKLLRSDLARDATFLTRFKREAQSAAGLNHASIVAVYDSGDEIVTEAGGAQRDVPYIVMEYVDGRTLRTLLTDEGPLDPKEAARITEGVLEALSYSHRMGIVHRDIKPANVMLAQDGTVKVMDFGIARAVADSSATMTQTQAVMGTAQYLSPEQAQGHTVDARSDLYSTGCMLFELLTGRPPFTGESPVAIAYQHVGEKPPLASDFTPGELSPEMDAVILHSLSKRRDDRYQDATTFRSDLQSARMGRSVSAAAWTGLEEYRDAMGSPLTESNGASATQVIREGTGGASAAAAASAGAADRDRPRESRAEPTEIYSAVTGPRRSPHPTAPVPATVPAPQARPVAYRRDPDTSAYPPVGRDDERSSLGWLWGALAALALVGIMWFALTNLLGEGEQQEPDTQVEVPSVVDLTYAQAQTELARHDLVPQRVDTASDAEPETVLEQSPIAGAPVDRGSTVRLTVSTGPGQSTVPDLSGMTESEARAALATAGLRLATPVVEVDDVTEPTGQVISQSPTSGTPVDADSEVSIQVSSGQMRVPNVIGMMQSDAQRTLGDQRLEFEIAEERDSTEFPAGTVLDQNPRAGLLEQGEVVRLVVAREPEPTEEPEPTQEPEPTEDPTDPPTGDGG
ncbi:MAG: Stk1 family PASTA domain-containing Ser/Thr kinase [Actinomycetia bacterium]|nr:Stk1 family PASTA domain-containing Ser/Thr kinase [Actinomycetes bacterium]